MNVGPTPNYLNRPIQLLPEHVIDQIKAGEVIERPANLLKELLENSIDAQASRIDIKICDHGLNTIFISDNGRGMSFEELPLAFCRHATSKLENFEDLYKISSFGFRGEALASIASIARVSCTSFPASPLAGGKIQFDGPKLLSHTKLSKISNDHGTTMIIRDLFFNTPVRLKFLKSKTMEKTSIRRVLTSFIISNPQIHFSIQWDEKEKEIYPSVEKNDWNSRLIKVLPFLNSKNNQVTTFNINGEYDGHSLAGIVAPMTTKGNPSLTHFLFVNKRLVQDQQVHNIIQYSFLSLEKAKNIAYCLFLNIPPERIDINIHPRKSTVKFMENNIVFSLVESAIKKAIEGNKEKTFSPIINPINNLIIEEKSPGSSDYPRNKNETFSYHQKQWEGNCTWQFLVPIEDHFYFIKFGEDCPLEQNFISVVRNDLFYFNLLTLCRYFFTESLLLAQKHPDQNILPLLISDPFACEQRNIDRHFPLFYNLGLEFDRLDKTGIILRSIPAAFSDIPYRAFILNWITYLEKCETVNQPNIDPHDFILNFILSDNFPFKILISQVHSFLNFCLKTLKISDLLQKNVLVRINRTICQKIEKASIC